MSSIPETQPQTLSLQDVGGSQPYIPPTKEQFAMMSASGQRVALMSDVRAQILADAFNAKRGAYVWIEGAHPGTPLCRLPSLGRCDVCALGATVLSACRVAGIEPPDFHDFPDAMARPIRYALEPFFDRKQLDLIECAFEGSTYNWMNLSGPESDACIGFWADQGDSRDVLLAIMENIIANNGEFKPEVSA